MAGVDGNGQLELEEVITGLRPPSTAACCSTGGTSRPRRRGSASPSGSAMSPPTATARHCFATSPSPTISCWSASTGRRSAAPAFSTVQRSRTMPVGWSRRSASAWYRSRAPAGQLSGGNAQKLVLARALSQEPVVLLVCQPTRGVDIGAIEQVHGEILRRRDAGTAILLDLHRARRGPGAFGSHSCAVRGTGGGRAAAGEATAEELGLMMGGRHAAPASPHDAGAGAPLIGGVVGLFLGP